MNQQTKREVVAALRQAGRPDLARHFTAAQPSRLERVLAKHKQNIAADLRLLIGKAGAASGAEKKANQVVMTELNNAFASITKQLGQLVSMS